MTKQKKKKNAHYVNNKEMVAELRQYKKTGIISEELGTMFRKIATRFATKGNFAGYTYKDDMISAATARMVSQIHKFDPYRSEAPNAFSYFTQIALNEFRAMLKKEKKQTEVKTNFREKIWEDICLEEMIQMIPEQIDDLSFEEEQEQEQEQEESKNEI